MSGRGHVYSPDHAAALRVVLLNADEAQALAQQVCEVLTAGWAQDLFAYDYALMGCAYRAGFQLAAEAHGLTLRFVVLDRQSLVEVSRSVPLPWSDLRCPDNCSEDDDEQGAALPLGSSIARWMPPRVRLAHDEGAEAMAEPRTKNCAAGLVFVPSRGVVCGVELFSDGQDRVRLAVVEYGVHGRPSHKVLLLSPWFDLRSIEAEGGGGSWR